MKKDEVISVTKDERRTTFICDCCGRDVIVYEWDDGYLPTPQGWYDYSSSTCAGHPESFEGVLCDNCIPMFNEYLKEHTPTQKKLFDEFVNKNNANTRNKFIKYTKYPKDINKDQMEMFNYLERNYHDIEVKRDTSDVFITLFEVRERLVLKWFQDWVRRYYADDLEVDSTAGGIFITTDRTGRLVTSAIALEDILPVDTSYERDNDLLQIKIHLQAKMYTNPIINKQAQYLLDDKNVEFKDWKEKYYRGEIQLNDDEINKFLPFSWRYC